jgi:NAD(P)H-hydrate epimerase
MACDRQAIDQLGIPGAVLMENAGRICSNLFSQEFVDLFPGPVLVLAGKGNNGGDGYVIARHLHNAGCLVKILICTDTNSQS